MYRDLRNSYSTQNEICSPIPQKEVLSSYSKVDISGTGLLQIGPLVPSTIYANIDTRELLIDLQSS